MAITEGNILISTSGQKLDTTVVTQTDATLAHREAVFLGDAEDLDGRVPIVRRPASASDYGAVIRPVLPMDAFGRIRTSSPQTVFNSQLQYDKSPFVWHEALTGGGTFTHDADGAFGIMAVGTANADAVVRQSPYQRYQPGKSQFIVFTVDFVEIEANCRKRAGYFDAENGVFFELDGSTVNFVLRSSVSGSVVETRVAQTAWSEDVHDGTGPGGFTLNATKSQVVWFDLEWLSVGTVRCGFFHGGEMHHAHSFHHANLINKSYMSTANLPVRYEIVNTGTLGSTTLMRQLCSAVMAEGGSSQDFGFLFSAGNGISTIAVTTRRAILSIRPKATFNSIVNRAEILPEGFDFFPSTSSGLVEVLYNPTLGGTPVWNSVHTDSVVEFDIAGTTITGGAPIAQAYVGAGGAGNNAFSDRVSEELAVRFPLNLDIAGANPRHLTLAVTALSGTCDALGSFAWKEIR